MSAAATAATPVWRSLLFVPVNVERFLAKAHERGADGIILDLEDSIAPSEKESARMALPGAVDRLRKTSRGDVLVRINQPLELAVRDLEAAVLPGVASILVTKVEGVSHLRLLDELVTRLEEKRGLPRGGIRFNGLVETPGPLAQVHAIARATPRLIALSLGAEDYATAIGGKPTEEVLLMPKQQVVQAACAAGLMAMGTIGTLAGFGGKWLLLSAMMERGWYGPLALGILATLVGLLYMVRFGHAVFLGPLKPEHGAVREAPAALVVPQFVLVAGILLLSFFPKLFMDPVSAAIDPQFASTLVWQGMSLELIYAYWNPARAMAAPPGQTLSAGLATLRRWRRLPPQSISWTDSSESPGGSSG